MLALSVLLVSLLAWTASAETTVRIADTRFLLNGAVTHQGAPAEGRLMNARMVNSVFEDRNRPSFDADANTDEFLAVMDEYVAAGLRAFTISLQGGDPQYEGAVNTAFTARGALRPTYMARVQRVIERADDLGAVIILSLFYQRQDQRLANEAAVRNAVVNTVNWVTRQGFTNVLIEIANEYPFPGYDHWIIKSTTGVTSLITLAKQTAPHLYVSTSGMPGQPVRQIVAHASDYILLHMNGTSVTKFPSLIAAVATYGKPVVINEDTKIGATGALAASTAVAHGASWGLWFRPNQYWPFVFKGPADDPIVYDRIRQLTTP